LDKPIRYLAERGEIIARPLGKTEAAIEVRLIADATAPVLEYNPRAEDYNKPIPKQTTSLDGLLLPQAVKDEVAQLTRQAVVDPSVDLGLEEEMLDKRIGLQRATGSFRRKVAALIHFRLGFSVSVLVTVLMGAALGVIFRGARALAAFGLAFVPFAIVGIMMLMGRQLGEHAGTEAVGVAIIWGGLLLVGLGDGLILRIGVRR
jgi:lipopolysaccharide export LptBFGC system permease protein LptF